MKHLIILQNGLNGWNRSMNSIKSHLCPLLGDNFTIVISTINDFHRTWDGIDECGLRLAEFIKEQCADGSFNKISFIAHSMGGLMIRNCIGKLEMEGFFSKIKPIIYASIATPHLGIHSAISYKKFLANWLLKLTGQQLLLQDPEHLLLKMSDPATGCMMGLSRFEYRLAYGNFRGDTSVDIDTACLTTLSLTDSPFPKGELFEITAHSVKKNKSESSIICDNLLQLSWIRKAIDLSDYVSVHTAIANNGYTSNTRVLDDIVSYLKINPIQ